MSTFTVKRGFINGFSIGRNAANPTGKIDIGSGECADSVGTREIKTSAIVTADITQSGAGGLDTGSEASDTWYAVFIIADSSGTNAPAALLSESADPPTMPDGYDIYRRVGWAWNNATNNFRPFTQKGDGNVRRYYYDLIPAKRRVLSGGNATSDTTIDLSDLIPTTSYFGYFQFGFSTGSGGSTTDQFMIKPKGFTNPIVRIRAGHIIDNRLSVPGDCPTDDNQDIEYCVSDSNNSAAISVMGYEDVL